jgi:hypothetical protein
MSATPETTTSTKSKTGKTKKEIVKRNVFQITFQTSIPGLEGNIYLFQPFMLTNEQVTSGWANERNSYDSYYSAANANTYRSKFKRLLASYVRIPDNIKLTKDVAKVDDDANTGKKTERKKMLNYWFDDELFDKMLNKYRSVLSNVFVSNKNKTADSQDDKQLLLQNFKTVLKYVLFVKGQTMFLNGKQYQIYDYTIELKDPTLALESNSFQNIEGYIDDNFLTDNKLFLGDEDEDVENENETANKGEEKPPGDGDNDSNSINLGFTSANATTQSTAKAVTPLETSILKRNPIDISSPSKTVRFMDAGRKKKKRRTQKHKRKKRVGGNPGGNPTSTSPVVSAPTAAAPSTTTTPAKTAATGASRGFEILNYLAQAEAKKKSLKEMRELNRSMNEEIKKRYNIYKVHIILQLYEIEKSVKSKQTCEYHWFVTNQILSQLITDKNEIKRSKEKIRLMPFKKADESNTNTNTNTNTITNTRNPTMLG